MSGDSPPDDPEKGDVGYRKPPRATRFTKGRSGNPGGRPRGRHREAPYEAVLAQMVTVREGEVTRRVTAAEAFLLQLSKRGLEGDGTAARDSLAAIERPGNEARRRAGVDQRHRPHKCGTRERHICARAFANGEETRSLPRDCTHGPRTVARRSRVGPSRSKTQPRRSVDDREGHSHAP